MPEYSYPFDGGSGSTINEDQWSHMARPWQDNGVEAVGPSATALKVSSQVVPLTLLVQPGHAYVEGFHYHLDEVKSLSFAENTNANPRVDRVVLRLDRTSNTVGLAVKAGIPAVSPVAPSVDVSWNTPEVSLATFTVRSGANTVTTGDVVDTRPFNGRRIQVSENLSTLPAGSIAYRPTSDTWGLVKAGGATDAIASAAHLAFVEGKVDNGGPALDAHIANPDAHPLYMNAERGDLRYSPKGHKHSFSASNFSFSPASGYTLVFASHSARAGMASLSLHYVRHSSAGATLSEVVGTIPTGHRPLAQTLLPAYVFSSDRATVTKAGAVSISTAGVISTYETYIGPNERIIITGVYLVTPGGVSTSTES
ncbi:hypothetical protein [Streptosporangium sp. OZ121]|uniref:hypothetical protein n=1 Tax=Streptosporangium sp. OZ121 TaxID=3444183 RepID=UPI003F7AE14A